MTCATYNRPPWGRTRMVLKTIGQGALLIVCGALAYLYVLAADAMINAHAPETRCFPRAAQEPDCRTQLYWE